MSWKDDITESFKFGLIDFFLLKLLSEKEMYGYEIKKVLKNRTNGMIDVGEGALYGPIYRLEKRKYISSIEQNIDGKKNRKYYKITEDGLKALKISFDCYNEVISNTKAFLNWVEGEDDFE